MYHFLFGVRFDTLITVKWNNRISQVLVALASFLVMAMPAYALTWSQADAEADFKGICKYAGANSGDCMQCITDHLGIWTAIGCIPATQTALFQKIFSVGISIAGGIAFLLILFGGFQILMSAGNPEKLNEGRELVSAAIAGLLLIIFSVFLLKIIGYEILRIPGFS